MLCFQVGKCLILPSCMVWIALFFFFFWKMSSHACLRCRVCVWSAHEVMARSHLEATYMPVNCIYCISDSSPTSPSRLCHVLDWFSIVHNCLPSPRTSGHEFDVNCCSCVTSNVSQHQTWCLHSAASQWAAVITVWGLNKDLGKQQHVAFAVSFTTAPSQCWAGRQGGARPPSWLKPPGSGQILVVT